MQVPILAYHAVNIQGNDYGSNDHHAFATDLSIIKELGLRIVPLQRVVDRLLGRNQEHLDACIALTCDDGVDPDYFDLDHPTCGPQRSMFNIMRDFWEREGVSSQPDLHLTCFVIADPLARAKIDVSCYAGSGWTNDTWWRPATLSRRISIGNHSWDHNHDCLPDPGPYGLRRGSFHGVASNEQAEYEITQAQDFLAGKLRPYRPSLFCYPYGHANEFLCRDWLPRRGEEIGLDAAFGDGAQPVSLDSNLWNLPRYVCGWHWRSPDQLREILSSVPRSK